MAQANPPPIGMNAADLQAIIQAVRPAAGPERDIKLQIFESGEPDEWLQWRARFENVARCKAWTDAQQRRALVQSMAGKAIEATQHVRVEEDAAAGHPALTPVQALNAYEAKFVTRAGTVRARSEFLAATQKQDEPLPQWHTRISTLYRRAHPNVAVENSHELIEKFCLGLWSTQVTERTLTDQPANMTDALEHASRHVATMLTMERRLDGKSRHNDKGLHAMQEKGQTSGGTAASIGNGKPGSSRNTATITCHFCKGPGHIRRNCYAYKRVLEERGRRAGGRGRGRGNSSGPGRRGGRSGSTNTGSLPPSLNALATFLDAALDCNNNETSDGSTTTATESSGSSTSQSGNC